MIIPILKRTKWCRTCHDFVAVMFNDDTKQNYLPKTQETVSKLHENLWKKIGRV